MMKSIMPPAVNAPRSALSLDSLLFGGLLAFVSAVQFSIFLGESLLALTLLGWIVALAMKRERFGVPPWFWALAAYAGITLVSTAFSLDRHLSLGACKQMLLFLVVPATYSIAKGRRADTLIQVLITVGAISAIVGVVEYGVLDWNFLGKRPRGTLGHYMTYSGLLMLVLCAVGARLLYRRRDWVWPALVLPAFVAALALTFTRSAWVGACAGIGLLLLLKDLRLLGVLPVLAALFIAVAPTAVTNRAYSMFNMKDPTNRDRFAMMEAGTDLVRRYPLTGVGPNVVHKVYPNYRAPSAVDQTPPHLHNVPLQIAAERGLPALAIWAWFVGTTAFGLWRIFRSAPERYLAAAGLAAIAAMLGAGFFEYNFGDSEFLMTFLVLLTLPWAAARGDGSTAESNHPRTVSEPSVA
jgi:O-antigen ligase